jgi:hypothetical protein
LYVVFFDGILLYEVGVYEAMIRMYRLRCGCTGCRAMLITRSSQSCRVIRRSSKYQLYKPVILLGCHQPMQECPGSILLRLASHLTHRNIIGYPGSSILVSFPLLHVICLDNLPLSAVIINRGLSLAAFRRDVQSVADSAPGENNLFAYFCMLRTRAM